MRKELYASLLLVMFGIASAAAADEAEPERTLSIFGRTSLIQTLATCSNTNTEWCVEGNAGSANHILGTTTADPLRLFANNRERARLLWLSPNPDVGRVAIHQDSTHPGGPGDALVTAESGSGPLRAETGRGAEHRGTRDGGRRHGRELRHSRGSARRRRVQ